MSARSRSPAAPAVRIDQVLLGKYRVDGILGEGGMGVVAKCTHLQLNERVAIKMLRPEIQLDEEAIERFMREAQAAVKLKSEYVAKVTDVGTLESGTPYMVMEFLEGIDLGVLLAQEGRIHEPWATQLVLQTAEALAEAHSIGIVHRDIKPANLFVTSRPDGTSIIKVLDFGISKSSMGTDMQLTQTQSLLGTPAYMSPEQMRSARLVDARSDMWSLGTVLYELIEGRKPFEADSFSEMCVKVALDAPMQMAHATPALQAVIMRCLAKTPEQRYASMAELGRELVPFAQDPQQGTVMVERMYRMLRRGDAAQQAGGGWEGSTTGSGLRATPYPVRDSASGASAWDVASNPAMRAFHPSQDRTPTPQPRPRDPSVPVSTSEAQIATAPIAIPRTRNKSLAIVLALLGAAAVGGLAFALTSNASKPAPARPTAEEVPPVALPVKATPSVAAPQPPTTNVEATPPPTQAAVAPPPTPPDEKNVVKKSKQTTKTVKKQPVVKQPEAKPPEMKPDPPKPSGCDPFDNAHRC